MAPEGIDLREKPKEEDSGTLDVNIDTDVVSDWIYIGDNNSVIFDVQLATGASTISEIELECSLDGSTPYPTGIKVVGSNKISSPAKIAALHVRLRVVKLQGAAGTINYNINTKTE